MIKLIIFDLDGVLVDTESIHHESLLESVEHITGIPRIRYEHLVEIDGRTTKQKLIELQDFLKLEDLDVQLIDDKKQQNVIRCLFRDLKTSPNQYEMLDALKEDYILAIASNSRKENVITILNILGITNFFSTILSNNDVVHPKPDPEIFRTAMSMEGILPAETLILEDSPAGKHAAEASGAYVLSINNMDMVNLGNIQDEIQRINTHNSSAYGRDGVKI